jgi:hypothetical protein
LHLSAWDLLRHILLWMCLFCMYPTSPDRNWIFFFTKWFFLFSHIRGSFYGKQWPGLLWTPVVQFHIYAWLLRMWPIGSPETLVSNHHMPCNNPEDRRIQFYICCQYEIVHLWNRVNLDLYKVIKFAITKNDFPSIHFINASFIEETVNWSLVHTWDRCCQVNKIIRHQQKEHVCSEDH